MDGKGAYQEEEMRPFLRNCAARAVLVVKLKRTQSIPGALLSACLPFVDAHNSSLICFTRPCLAIFYATITIDMEALITPAEKIQKYHCHKWACNFTVNNPELVEKGLTQWMRWNPVEIFPLHFVQFVPPFLY